MEPVYIYCSRCKKKTLRKNIRIEEREVKGKFHPYRFNLTFGECCECGMVNSNLKRKIF